MSAKAKLAMETTNDTSKAEKSFDNIRKAAKKANDEIKRDGVNVSEAIARKNREGVNNLVGRLSWVRIAIAAIEHIAKNLATAFGQMVQEGNKFSEAAAFGISAETMASLKAKADAAGVSLEDYNKSLEDLKTGRTSLDELSRSWKDMAQNIYGAKEANNRFFENLSDNIEAIAVSKNIEKLTGGIGKLWRNAVSGLVRISGNGSEAESTIEYAVPQGIRGERGRDKAIRAAIRERFYSPVEGTAMWNARYKELGDLFDARASAVDTERRNSRDDRVASLYDRLGENVGLVMNALSKLGLGNLTETEVSEAVYAVAQLDEAITRLEENFAAGDFDGLPPDVIEGFRQTLAHLKSARENLS